MTLPSNVILKEYTCKICDKKFKSKNACYQHKRMAHIKLIPSCPICKKTFKNKEYAEHHKLWACAVCSICSKTFSGKSSMVQHMISKHPSAPLTYAERIEKQRAEEEHWEMYYEGQALLDEARYTSED